MNTRKKYVAADFTLQTLANDVVCTSEMPELKTFSTVSGNAIVKTVTGSSLFD